MKKWKWQSRRRPELNVLRGKDRQMVKVRIRNMLSGEEDLYDGERRIPAERAGRNRSTLAA